MPTDLLALCFLTVLLLAAGSLWCSPASLLECDTPLPDAPSSCTWCTLLLLVGSWSCCVPLPHSTCTPILPACTPSRGVPSNGSVCIHDRCVGMYVAASRSHRSQGMQSFGYRLVLPLFLCLWSLCPNLSLCSPSGDFDSDTCTSSAAASLGRIREVAYRPWPCCIHLCLLCCSIPSRGEIEAGGSLRSALVAAAACCRGDGLALLLPRRADEDGSVRQMQLRYRDHELSDDFS